MRVDNYNIQRFLALSELYFGMTSNTAPDTSSEKMEEFLKFINDCSPPSMPPEKNMA